MLKKGDTGKLIVPLQKQLNYWGIRCDEEGFGEVTEIAVKYFQEKRQRHVVYASGPLTIDGVVGVETWAELFKVTIEDSRKQFAKQPNKIDPNITAFLKMIRVHEGTKDDDGYRRMFGGNLFSDYSDHPRKLQTGSGITSDAAGAYQFLSTTWDSVAEALGLTDFSPANQDRGAIELIRRRGAYEDVIEGRINEALEKCSWEWASMPPGRYGQPSCSYEEAIDLYLSYGGICV
ncbi:MAG: hypothetical protein ACRC78_02625 [Planktothrix sp.]